MLVAIVELSDEIAGRQYRVAKQDDYEAIFAAKRALSRLEQRASGIPPVPDEPLPLMSGTFNVPIYGVDTWGKLFTSRQKLAICSFVKAINTLECDEKLKNVLALVLDRVVSRSSSLCVWRFQADQEKVEHVFGRQALPFIWDFAEAVVTSESTGSFADGIEVVITAIESLRNWLRRSATVQQADACNSPNPDETADIWFTDPPYYFAVPYADLSDFFFVWLKRTLPNRPFLKDPFDESNPLTPKERELCEMSHWDMARYSHKDQSFFESGMKRAFEEGRRMLKDEGAACVVFAHKTTEGWEALLSGMVSAGWVVTGSWPLTTEMPNRLRARESAALAASIHLVCRPRADDAGIGDWAEVFRELPNRVGQWIEKLQAEGVRGADLVFACIGPAMEVYSRYNKVEDAEGREIPLGGDPTATEPYERGFLAYVWETVGRLALEQVLGTAEAKARNGAAGALEEDSRLTALSLWTIQATDTEPTAKDADADDDDEDADEDEGKPKKKKAGLSLIYDVARRFAQPLGIHLDKWEGRIIETEKGVVRLLPVGERAKQIFGEESATSIAHRIEQDVKASRNYTFAFMEDVANPPQIKPRTRKAKATAAAGAEPPAPQTVTTLDRLHAAMLLQAGGQSNGLRAMLKEEQQRGPDFLRLANALTALYPKDSEEKRLLDAMLLAVPRN